MISLVLMVTLPGPLMVLVGLLSTPTLTEIQVIPVVTVKETPTVVAPAKELVQLADPEMDSGAMASTFLALRTPVLNANFLVSPTTLPSNRLESTSPITTTFPLKRPARTSLNL
jgi:hypothetical protein